MSGSIDMDIFDVILKSDIADLLDKAKNDLGETKAVVLIQVLDDGDIRIRSVNLNDFETVGVLELAKLEVLDDDDDT